MNRGRDVHGVLFFVWGSGDNASAALLANGLGVRGGTRPPTTAAGRAGANANVQMQPAACGKSQRTKRPRAAPSPDTTTLRPTPRPSSQCAPLVTQTIALPPPFFFLTFLFSLSAIDEGGLRPPHRLATLPGSPSAPHDRARGGPGVGDMCAKAFSPPLAPCGGVPLAEAEGEGASSRW